MACMECDFFYRFPKHKFFGFGPSGVGWGQSGMGLVLFFFNWSATGYHNWSIVFGQCSLEPCRECPLLNVIHPLT